MKHAFRRLALVGMVISLTLVLPALAASKQVAQPTRTTARFWFDLSVSEVHGSPTFVDEHGRHVGPFALNGTVYIPVYTAASWMGCTVAWDQETETIHLTSGQEPYFFTAGDIWNMTEEDYERRDKERVEGVPVTVSPQISVTLDGEPLVFENVNGEPVYPVVAHEAAYLPVRSIGELCGMEVLFLPAWSCHNGGHSLAEEYIQMPASVYLYDPISQEELAAARELWREGSCLREELVKIVERATASEPLSNDVFWAAVEEMEPILQKLRAVEDPKVPFYHEFYDDISRFYPSYELPMYISFSAEDMTAKGGAADWNEEKKHFEIFVGDSLANFWISLNEFDQLLTAMGA